MRFTYKKINRKTSKMNSLQLKICRKKFKIKIVYIDETWFDYHDSIFKRWVDKQTDACH